MGSKMKKIIYGIMAFAVVFLGKAVSAHAAEGDLYSVDVNGANYSGAGYLTNGAGNWWTTISGAQVGGIPISQGILGKTSSDGFTAISLSYTADASTAINPASTSFGATTSQALFDGYMTTTGTGSIDFTGLAANKSFQFVVYSQAETLTPTALTINGTPVITNATSTANTLSPGVNYYVVDGLSSNGSGALNFTYSGQISGFQLKEVSSPVPEPSTIILMGIGGLLFVAFSLRKSQAASTLVA